MQKHTKEVILFYIVLAALCVFTIWHSAMLAADDLAVTGDVSLKNRNIESNMKLVFNGYLGMFFNYKMLGTLTWLTLPLVCFGFLSFRKLAAELKAILIGFAILALLISLRGYFNYRYQLTLYPVMILTVVITAYQFDEYYKLGLRPHLIFGLLVLFLANSNFLMYYSKVAAKLKGGEAAVERAGVPKRSQDFHDMVALIEKTPAGNFLVNDVSLFFYYTKRKGVYLWGERDIYYDSLGYNYSLTALDQEGYEKKITDTLRCEYVFSSVHYSKLASQKFQSFLQQKCSVIDSVQYAGNTYVVYSIKK